MRDQQPLREHLLELLAGASAHIAFEKAIANWPEPLRGVKAEGVPYSAWQLLEHMRIAQWDILEFSRNPDHRSPDWPEGYWPAGETPPNVAAWDQSGAAFQRELEEMKRLVSDPAVDLFARIPHGNGQTVLREALLVADHSAYHLGQLVLLRRLLGGWPDE